MKSIKNFFYGTRFFWYGALFHTFILSMLTLSWTLLVAISMLGFLAVYLLDKKFIERKELTNE
jgi:hypothetical protein